MASQNKNVITNSGRGSKKANIKATPFLPPFPVNFTPSSSACLPASSIPIPSLKQHRRGSCSQSITAHLCHSFFLTLFLCSSMGASQAAGNTCSGAMEQHLLLLTTLVFPLPFLSYFLPFLKCTLPEAPLVWLRGLAMPFGRSTGTSCVWHGAAPALPHGGCPAAPRCQHLGTCTLIKKKKKKLVTVEGVQKYRYFLLVRFPACKIFLF